VVGWLVAQVAEFATENFGAPEWVLKIFVVFLILGLPMVLVFAWAFEMTPEGLKREKDVERSESITQATGQKLNYTIIALLAVAVAYLLMDKLFLGPGSIQERPVAISAPGSAQPADDAVQKTSSAPEGPVAGPASANSIAVLPFVNMSADAENEYFSDGISEELLNVLAKVNSLHVASRTSAFAFKGQNLPIGEIARQLQVEHVLEGSVRKAGNRVRITAQLIDSRNDKHLWSETYERELDDIFDIQEEISNAIVNELKVALNVTEQEAVSRAQRPTDNAEAYELYLQGRYRWRQRQEGNIRSAIGLFERAVALDPEFAAAYEALAAAHGSLSSWSTVTNAEAMATAVPYARRALELDPALSEARAIIAEDAGDKWQWGEIYSQYELALQYTPNSPTINQWFAEILHNLGYLDRALEQALRAYELDPTSPVINNVTMYIAIAAGQDELAFRHWRIATDLGVSEAANNNLVPLLLARGEIDRFIELREWGPGEVPLCVQARTDASLLPALREQVRQIDPFDPSSGWNPGVLASCLALVGDVDAAMDIYGRFIHEQDWYAFNDFWNHQEEYVRMRRSEPFKQLVSKMGLVDFWRENGWPDLCRPLGEVDFECE